MDIVGKIVTLAVSLGIWAGLACASGAETLRADRKGDVAVKDIERFLAHARITPRSN